MNKTEKVDYDLIAEKSKFQLDQLEEQLSRSSRQKKHRRRHSDSGKASMKSSAAQSQSPTVQNAVV